MTPEDREALRAAAEDARSDGDWELSELDKFRLRTPDGMISLSWTSSDGRQDQRAVAVALFLSLANPASILTLLADRDRMAEALSKAKELIGTKSHGMSAATVAGNVNQAWHVLNAALNPKEADHAQR